MKLTCLINPRHQGQNNFVLIISVQGTDQSQASKIRVCKYLPFFCIRCLTKVLAQHQSLNITEKKRGRKIKLYNIDLISV
jgi:hypothetical protein